MRKLQLHLSPDEPLIGLPEDAAAARYAALHDALTGLPNRLLFEDRLAHGLAQARRHGRTLAVMSLDLDEFKQINARHGQSVGDAVLTTVADRLKENTRQEDTVSRANGDGFLYLVAEFGDLKDVTMIAEKITQALRVPCLLTVGPVHIRASVGIAIFPNHGDSVHDLIERADQAMQLAKGNPAGYAFAG